MIPEGIDAAEVAALREKVALGSRVLAKMELVDYLGHVSARVSGGAYALIRARGAEQGNQLHMTPEQVTLVDLDAQHVDGAYRAPDETRLHTELYKARPDVTAVVHTHQPIATIFGDLEKPILPMQGVMASVVRDPIPIYPSSRKVTTPEQGAEVARALGERRIVHLQNHGIAIVGTSVEQVVIDAIWLEHQAKLTLWASMIGTPRGMRRDELEAQAGDAFGIEGRWRYYTSLLEE
ncbi:MAG TPA: class II aldolase/adducin family protein [Candidatus Elarobacter sp.]|jgi:ribulose-5-phosphate 4-epimerase/fuculose-1-phosphate aldolase|nr:class II aldolase/adducin family protein [Candidatus Elarobacter sp.]